MSRSSLYCCVHSSWSSRPQAKIAHHVNGLLTNLESLNAIGSMNTCFSSSFAYSLQLIVSIWGARKDVSGRSYSVSENTFSFLETLKCNRPISHYNENNRHISATYQYFSQLCETNGVKMFWLSLWSKPYHSCSLLNGCQHFYGHSRKLCVQVATFSLAMGNFLTCRCTMNFNQNELHADQTTLCSTKWYENYVSACRDIMRKGSCQLWCTTLKKGMSISH